jgi:hypothetical protein
MHIKSSGLVIGRPDVDGLKCDSGEPIVPWIFSIVNAVCYEIL